jgi:hypothetical protein
VTELRLLSCPEASSGPTPGQKATVSYEKFLNSYGQVWGVIGFDLGHVRPHENPSSVQSEGPDCVRTKAQRQESLRQFHKKLRSRRLHRVLKALSARQEPRPTKFFRSMDLAPYRAKVSLREITWNGVNETVIRCSSSTRSSLAGSSRILTIAAFFNGRAVSKVV